MNIRSHLNTTKMRHTTQTRNTTATEVVRTQGMKVKLGAVLYGNTGQFGIVFHALLLVQYKDYENYRLSFSQDSFTSVLYFGENLWFGL